MNSGPTVSVIIPTFNRAALLKEALDNVLAQTFRDLEIIVVDDGSTDATAATAASAAARDGRLRYVHHANCGLDASRNRGAAVASAVALQPGARSLRHAALAVVSALPGSAWLLSRLREWRHRRVA